MTIRSMTNKLPCYLLYVFKLIWKKSELINVKLPVRLYVEHRILTSTSSYVTSGKEYYNEQLTNISLCMSLNMERFLLESSNASSCMDNRCS